MNIGELGRALYVAEISAAIVLGVVFVGSGYGLYRIIKMLW